MSVSTASPLPQPTQPGTILGTQILLGAVYALEFLQALPGGPVAATASRTHPLLAFLLFLAVGATAWLMGWAAHTGRKSLRLTFCVGIASLGSLLLANGQSLSPLGSAQLLMVVAACVLLYTPPSNAWFTLRDAQRTNPALANVLLQQAHQQRLHARAQASAAKRNDILLSVYLLLAASAVMAAKLFLPLLSA